MKKGLKSGLHSKKTEYMFCEEMIKLIIIYENRKKYLHFEMWKKSKELMEMSDKLKN